MSEWLKEKATNGQISSILLINPDGIPPKKKHSRQSLLTEEKKNTFAITRMRPRHNTDDQFTQIHSNHTMPTKPSLFHDGRGPLIQT